MLTAEYCKYGAVYIYIAKEKTQTFSIKLIKQSANSENCSRIFVQLSTIVFEVI